MLGTLIYIAFRFPKQRYVSEVPLKIVILTAKQPYVSHQSKSNNVRIVRDAQPETGNPGGFSLNSRIRYLPCTPLLVEA